MNQVILDLLFDYDFIKHNCFLLRKLGQVNQRCRIFSQSSMIKYHSVESLIRSFKNVSQVKESSMNKIRQRQYFVPKFNLIVYLMCSNESEGCSEIQIRRAPDQGLIQSFGIPYFRKDYPFVVSSWIHFWLDHRKVILFQISDATQTKKFHVLINFSDASNIRIHFDRCKRKMCDMSPISGLCVNDVSLLLGEPFNAFEQEGHRFVSRLPQKTVVFVIPDYNIDQSYRCIVYDSKDQFVKIDKFEGPKKKPIALKFGDMNQFILVDAMHERIKIFFTLTQKFYTLTDSVIPSIVTKERHLFWDEKKSILILWIVNQHHDCEIQCYRLCVNDGNLLSEYIATLQSNVIKQSRSNYDDGFKIYRDISNPMILDQIEKKPFLFFLNMNDCYPSRNKDGSIQCDAIV